MDQQHIIILISLYVVEPTQLHMGASPCAYLQVTINFSRPASIQRDGEAFDKNFPSKNMGSMKVPPCFFGYMTVVTVV